MTEKQSDFRFGVVPAGDCEIKFTESHNPTGKLADAELVFTSGLLAGLKLCGFGIWQRRTGSGKNVTFPARSYAVNGERRSFALLRPSAVLGESNSMEDHDRFRDAIVRAYEYWEEHRTVEQPQRDSAQR